MSTNPLRQLHRVPNVYQNSGSFINLIEYKRKSGFLCALILQKNRPQPTTGDCGIL